LHSLQTLMLKTCDKWYGHIHIKSKWNPQYISLHTGQASYPPLYMAAILHY
jgi:hypothetical protein